MFLFMVSITPFVALYLFFHSRPNIPNRETNGSYEHRPKTKTLLHQSKKGKSNYPYSYQPTDDKVSTHNRIPFEEILKRYKNSGDTKALVYTANNTAQHMIEQSYDSHRAGDFINNVKILQARPEVVAKQTLTAIVASDCPRILVLLQQSPVLQKEQVKQQFATTTIYTSPPSSLLPLQLR